MEPSKKLYILIGSLVLVVLILVLVVFFTRKDYLPVKERETIMVSTCPAQINYQGVVYQAKKIGEQCWMVENLKASNYRDGTAIPNLLASADWAENKEGAYACYYNEESYCQDYGALYNWYAVNNEKGLCPEGWSVPSHEQWTELERAVCQDLGYQDCQGRFPNEKDLGWRGTDEGEHLLSADLGGKDKYGFGAILGGLRNAAGPYLFIEESGFWWTASGDPDDEDAGYGRVISKDNKGIRRVTSSKSNGFSVRCLMD